MIRYLACLGLLATLASTQSASADTVPPSSAPVGQAFGNTIVSTYPDGRTGELWLAPGGVYAAEGRRGDLSRGRWSVKGKRLCLKQVKPSLFLFNTYCTPVPRATMGESWTAKAPTGEAISVRVVEGHVSGGAKSPDGRKAGLTLSKTLGNTSSRAPQ